MSIYTELKAAGCQLEHHESDLYVRNTPEARRVLQGASSDPELFKDGIDGERWFLLSFAYDPFWEGDTRA